MPLFSVGAQQVIQDYTVNEAVVYRTPVLFSAEADGCMVNERGDYTKRLTQLMINTSECHPKNSNLASII